ncbi:hypothetical protein MRB53_036004 [Persea americana]|uniref:Uncharacterized protein n=1 Tax=Persea americana TaxID=3435 RepID=A0ACC2K695_PERAE|nr:hypothetical protein MRB53_036004 [Persea americana]
MLENMLLSSSAILPCPIPSTFSSYCRRQKLFQSLQFKKRRSSFICMKFGVEEIAELAQNKAFVAVAVCTVIGQLSKPFSSALYGNGVNFRAVFQSGGMPSTHSAGVVAAATSLGLERGLSDSVFGMSVVFAAIVMYDAQGVRREVGYHAKILNKILLEAQQNSTLCPEEDDLINSKQETLSISSKSLPSLFSSSEKPTTHMPNSMPASGGSDNVARRINSLPSSLAVVGKEVLNTDYNNYIPLKEYVGHTEREVLVGALLGFVVSLVIEMIL